MVLRKLLTQGEKMRILVTGGCGFLGSNLASYGIEHSYDITVFDNLSRLGSRSNLKWLNTLGKVRFVEGDTSIKEQIATVIREGRFDAIFHLAGQVAMTTSISDPYRDFQVNALGALNVLESVRNYSPQTAVFFSSTNKVYGDLEQYTYEELDTRYKCVEYPNGFDETVPLDFRSPYGCSKGTADQYMLDYSRIYGIKATVFRHSSMYGGRQFASSDQGWVGWFVQKAYEKAIDPNIAPFTISGSGKQVRDILHAEDMISLYYSSLSHVDDVFGSAYNVGGTMAQSLSLLELFELLNNQFDVELNYTKLPPRQSDQKVFVADIGKIHKKTGWVPKVSAKAGLQKMAEWTREMSSHSY